MTVHHDFLDRPLAARAPSRGDRADEAATTSPSGVTWGSIARRLASNRLVQFAVLGGAIFAVTPRPRSARDIDIESERLAALHAAEAARTGAPTLDADATRAVDQRALEDELLYREGVRLGLDKNDGIVRQRVVQKVLFLAEELGGASRPPTEAELAAFFRDNRDRWTVGEHLRFEQIYRHTPEDLARWMAGPKTDAPPASEPSPVAAEIDTDLATLGRSLGTDFANALSSAPTGRWVGPIASAYGAHLVRIVERTPGHPAELSDVRGAVLEEYSVHRRQEATARFLTDAFARYRVAIDGKPLTSFEPSRRIAFRSVASGED